MTEVRSWFKNNQTLVYFLLAQALAIATAGLTFTAYMVRLETRVTLLETRGSSHLSEINNRLTVTEKETQSNRMRVDRIIDIMTRKLGTEVH